MKRSLHERLFSIHRSAARTVVRFMFLKFTFKVRELQPKYLQNADEKDYPRLLGKWYWRSTGERLDLLNPVTFNEKIQWLKLYGDRKLMTRLSDKIAARDYVARRIGGKYLVPLVGTYNNSSEINWEKVPERFVLKPNHGSHWLRIVESKSCTDLVSLSQEADGWLAKDYSFMHGFELQYRDIPRKLMIERHLGDFTHDIKDYKIWCFGGKPLYVQVYSDRPFDNCCHSCFYSLTWEKQPFWKKNQQFLTEDISRPAALDEMIDCAARLTVGENGTPPIPFARVDFYGLDDGSLRFGEITFTPTSGNAPWLGHPTIDRELGDILVLHPCEMTNPHLEQ